MDEEQRKDKVGLVASARAVRGVVAAALVTSDGEVVASEADDDSLLNRMQDTATSAMAAAEAFADLLPGDDDQTITVIYQDGHPLLFSPIAAADHVMVVALDSAADIGRARFQLKRLAAA